MESTGQAEAKAVASSSRTPSIASASPGRQHQDDHDSASTAESDDLDLHRKISQAYEEGHDADVVGSALGPVRSHGRRPSLAMSRASARRTSNVNRVDAADLEKGTGDDDEPGTAGDDATADESLEVWWDSDDDPTNPFNWPQWQKVLNTTCISVMTFVTPLGSSIFAPGVPEVMNEFQSGSLLLASFVVSVYLLGFAFGPLLIAPLSEIYGRVIVYHVTNVGFTIFCVACALSPSLNALIVFRFFCGIFGCASVTNGGGTIADMIRQESRGVAMSLYSIGPLLGPIVGPVAGGFISQSLGWRWAFWVLAIIGGVVTVASFFVLKESFAYVILQRKTNRLRKETGNPLLRSRLDAGLGQADFFKRGIIRPVKMFIKSPIVVVTSLYMSLIYGYLYLMFTTMTTVFQGAYGFSTGITGLAFLGLGVGNLAGLAIFSATSDKYIQRKAAEADALAETTGAAKEGMKPEYRLPLLPVGAFLVPIGLFIYGWTAQYHVHWIVPIISHVFIGIGNLVVFMALQTYLVDCFTIYAASAIATNTVVRSVVGALLPLAGLPMFESLGLGWGNSLLGFIAVATIPISFVLIRWGESLRKRYPVRNL
ncbi:bicyclomycin resistance protein [Microdochium trichocladiopsis]|uniref:Bicyclomycin resistance protein n=1 Tax=Microdochium trichocladiopsis TaxID=1682393 RepID=A0A9P8XS52_9PEZI|nr:bicyclomycin resistance protein [Microdochium trichocladiopsis]KAH7014407.1 bicyclomycin resistance protein [Microdochium trichocladiopsis]